MKATKQLCLEMGVGTVKHVTIRGTSLARAVFQPPLRVRGTVCFCLNFYFILRMKIVLQMKLKALIIQKNSKETSNLYHSYDKRGLNCSRRRRYCTACRGVTEDFPRRACLTSTQVVA